MATSGSAGARKGSRQIARRARIALSVLVALMIVVPANTQSAQADTTGISSSGGLNLTVGSVPAVDDPNFWPPVTFWWSRDQVERAWDVLGFQSKVCMLPLPIQTFGVCLKPASQADAIASAHYQQKRIKQVHYGCRLAMFCDRDDFFVLP